jgi:hypothetical protein
MDQTADTPAQRAAAGVGDSFDGWGPTLEDQRRCDMPEENLTTIDEGIRHVQRRQAGDRSGTRAPTDEAIGDSDQGSPEAAEEAGAAAGVVAGTAIAGPIGMIAGAAIGAAAGAAGEGDHDRLPTHDAERKAEDYDEWRHSDDRPEERAIGGARPRPGRR